jgi:hypothetical protein
MVNYNLGKIYKIIDNTTDNIYIGSTCEPTLARRLASHVAKYKYYLQCKTVYVTSFKILKNDNYNIILIEQCACNNRDELLARERFHIENTECVNKVIPGRTNHEYRKENKEKIKECSKKYQEENKEKISKIQKIYYTNNKDKIKENSKQYHENNKEKILKKQRIYYQQNKKKLYESHICSCGGKYSIKHKLRHSKTLKHQTWLQTQNSDSENSSSDESTDSESSSDSDNSSDDE